MLRFITFRRVLFWLILVGGFYSAVCYAQTYFYATGFDDFVDNEVKFAPTRETTKEAMTAHILDAAREFGVEVGPRDIRIQKNHDKQKNFDKLIVDVSYVAQVDLNFFKLPVHFHTNSTVTY